MELKNNIFLNFKYNTKFILLKKFTSKNITTKYLHWLNNKNLMRYSRQKYYMHNIKSVKKYMKEMQDNLFLAIYIKKKINFIHVGNLSIYFNKKKRSASISILIGSTNYRNMGVGKIVWLKTINKLSKFEFLDVISAGTHYKNKGMIKIFNYSKMKIFKKGNKIFYRKKVKNNIS